MTFRFCADTQFHYEVLMALGSAYRQGADVGEVLTAAAAVTDGDPQAWFATWTALARRVRAQAEQAAGTGNLISARGAYLRAAGYFGTALVSVNTVANQEHLGPVFREHRDCFERFAAACDPPAERVAIPYGSGDMPGFLFTPAGAEPAGPVVIVSNGSEWPITTAWTKVGAGAVERGYRVLLFDGPGQQSMLFERHIPFRPDWEHVITPVVDYLVGRDDVLPERIGLVGISQSGYWVPRALAFEHRIAAAVADPGVFEVVESWWSKLQLIHQFWKSGNRDAFDRVLGEVLASDPQTAAEWRWRATPFGDLPPFDLLLEVSKYSLADVVHRITTPLLITEAENETIWPGQSKKLYDALPGPRELVRFAAADGDDLHGEPSGRAVFEQRVFDWLDARLLRGGGPAGQARQARGQM